jgi:hypothetical protein
VGRQLLLGAGALLKSQPLRSFRAEDLGDDFNVP